MYDPRAIANKDIFLGIWSAIPPVNPKQGVRWNEINDDGFLVEHWVRQENEWVSLLKTNHYTSARSSGHDVRLALNSARKIIIKESRILLIAFNNQPPNGSVEISHFLFNGVGLNPIPVSSEIVSKRFISGLVNNGCVLTPIEVNLLIPEATNNSYLQILTRSIGGNTSHTISSQLDYYYIRK